MKSTHTSAAVGGTASRPLDSTPLCSLQVVRKWASMSKPAHWDHMQSHLIRAQVLYYSGPAPTPACLCLKGHYVGCSSREEATQKATECVWVRTCVYLSFCRVFQMTVTFHHENTCSILQWYMLLLTHGLAVDWWKENTQLHHHMHCMIDMIIKHCQQ